MLEFKEYIWFVDWESAFLNDHYLDLAIVANFVVRDEIVERAFLEAYFEKVVDEYRYARFFLMQVLLHLYYFAFLMVFDSGDKPIDLGKIPKHGFRDFHTRMWSGAIRLAYTDAKHEYAILHLEQFRLKSQTTRFEESLRLVSNP